MQLFKRFLDFYINSSIHVSLSVVALCWITYLSLDINVNYALLLFVFLATITGYNFVKYAKIAGLHHRSLTSSLRAIQIFSVLCAIGLAITAFQMSLETRVACGVLGCVTLFYAVPFFVPENRKSLKGNLRSIAGLKIYIIGFVWAGATVLLPVIEEGISISLDILIVFLQRFLLVLALMVPFEIRDLNYDELLLKTLPQVVGVKKAKIIGVTWLLLFLVLLLFRDELSKLMIWSHLFVVFLLGGFIALSRKRQSIYYTSFFVEGIPLLWLVLLIEF